MLSKIGFLVFGLVIYCLAASGAFGEPGSSSARGDAADLARAALTAKARGQCASAIALFDEALRQGSLPRGERGLLIYSRGVCLRVSAFAKELWLTWTQP